jgi:DNA-binding CsgD family transcriptional regulator
MTSDRKPGIASLDTGPSGVPSWVHSMGLPIWITDASGSIYYLNPRAEALFGHSLDEWVGLPCHLCIAGRTQTGPVCGPRCRVRRQAAARTEIEPVRVWLPAAEETGEVSVVVITSGRGLGQLLIHCVVDDERERRIRRFMDGVIHRSVQGSRQTDGALAGLTKREREVLSLLAADASLNEVAEHLCVSYTTVRNHVAHVLRKLGVHSILEAVAVWVMDTRE